VFRVGAGPKGTCSSHTLPPCVSAACHRYYLNSFYPPDQVTVPYSLVEAAVGLANVAAAPLAASLLMLDGKSGMHGWQWWVGQWLQPFPGGPVLQW